jgi:cytochrome c2
VPGDEMGFFGIWDASERAASIDCLAAYQARPATATATEIDD